MTQKSNHAPSRSDPSRARCPVCHEAVYSRAGIHPQCAVKQSDTPQSKKSPVIIPQDALAVEVESLAQPPTV